MTLPKEGRAGDPPEWPLSKASKRELTLWAREWARPQAIVWEGNGQEVEVAMYVRCLAKAERADAPINLRTLVKQQQEALGISLPGLLRNRWRIGEVKPAAAGPTGGPGVSARERFRVVTGGAA